MKYNYINRSLEEPIPVVCPFCNHVSSDVKNTTVLAAYDKTCDQCQKEFSVHLIPKLEVNSDILPLT